MLWEKKKGRMEIGKSKLQKFYFPSEILLSGYSPRWLEDLREMAIKNYTKMDLKLSTNLLLIPIGYTR